MILMVLAVVSRLRPPALQHVPDDRIILIRIYCVIVRGRSKYHAMTLNTKPMQNQHASCEHEPLRRVLTT